MHFHWFINKCLQINIFDFSRKKKKTQPEVPRAKDTRPVHQCSVISCKSSASAVLVPPLQTRVLTAHTAQCFNTYRRKFNCFIWLSSYRKQNIISNHSSLHCARIVSQCQANDWAVASHWGCHEKASAPKMSCLPFGEPLYFNVAVTKQRPLKRISTLCLTFVSFSVNRYRGL